VGSDQDHGHQQADGRDNSQAAEEEIEQREAEHIAALPQ
jgi:hypothetical protein